MTVKKEVNEIWDAIDTGQGFTSVDELCRAMNFSEATAYRYIKDQTLPSPVKIGGRTFFVTQKLKDYMEQLTEASACQS